MIERPKRDHSSGYLNLLSGRLYDTKIRLGKALAEIARLKLDRSVRLPIRLANEADDILEIPNLDFPCVYFLVQKDTVVYVGETCNLLNRLIAHKRTKEFDRVLVRPLKESEFLNIVESHYIDLLQPPLNINGKASRRIAYRRNTVGGCQN